MTEEVTTVLETRPQPPQPRELVAINTILTQLAPLKEKLKTTTKDAVRGPGLSRDDIDKLLHIDEFRASVATKYFAPQIEDGWIRGLAQRIEGSHVILDVKLFQQNNGITVYYDDARKDPKPYEFIQIEDKTDQLRDRLSVWLYPNGAYKLKVLSHDSHEAAVEVLSQINAETNETEWVLEKPAEKNN